MFQELMPFKSMENDIILAVKITPNASKTRAGDIIKDQYNNLILKIYIKSQAIDGKANKELIKFLSEIFQVSSSSITIDKGLLSRDKLVKIRNIPTNKAIFSINSILQ